MDGLIINKINSEWMETKMMEPTKIWQYCRQMNLLADDLFGWMIY